MGTWQLDGISCQLRCSRCLQPGDILNEASSHVVLYDRFGTNGVYVYESTTYNRYDRVIYALSPWSRLSGYVPRRYCSVCGVTCRDSCALSPSPCP